MEGTLAWTIPDLQVIVSANAAVTWGIRRMAAESPGPEMVDALAGHAIFRKVGDSWKMIHQHVSFPYDPDTNEAVMDSAS